MNEYLAIELAFENGYKKAAKEIFDEVENRFVTDGVNLTCSIQDFAELKKKYTKR